MYIKQNYLPNWDFGYTIFTIDVDGGLIFSLFFFFFFMLNQSDTLDYKRA